MSTLQAIGMANLSWQKSLWWNWIEVWTLLTLDFLRGLHLMRNMTIYLVFRFIIFWVSRQFNHRVSKLGCSLSALVSYSCTFTSLCLLVSPVTSHGVNFCFDRKWTFSLEKSFLSPQKQLNLQKINAVAVFIIGFCVYWEQFVFGGWHGLQHFKLRSFHWSTSQEPLRHQVGRQPSPPRPKGDATVDRLDPSIFCYVIRFDFFFKPLRAESETFVQEKISNVLISRS